MEEARFYDELYIKVAPQFRQAFFELLDESLSSGSNGWRRMKRSEIARTGSRECYYYICTATGERPKALLAIYPHRNPELVYVSNVVSQGGEHPFKAHRYNAVIADFHDNVLMRVGVEFPVLAHWREMDRRVTDEERITEI